MFPVPLRCLLRTLPALVPAFVSGAAAGGGGPLEPAAALRAFRPEPGVRVEVFAAEPLVVDPVAFAFDERGRLLVVENRGYPGEVKRDQSRDDAPAAAEGRIALLEDTDGDGRPDRRHEYATGLGYPNGILPWRGGVFVTCAPDILYLKDHDGDGVAEERTVVLTGFSTSRTTQIRTSHPTLGLDGWVYVTSGLNGGKVRSPRHPERPEVSYAPADARFHPETLEFQVVGGRGQFGLAFDEFGRRFNTSNRHPIQQIVLEPAQLRRNPLFAFSETVQAVSRVEAEAVVWPAARARVTADFIPALLSKPHTGTFTSACGLVVHAGLGLGAERAGSAYICEPAQNLVQRQVLRAEGPTFRAEPATRGAEFLASTDSWFRPVFAADGPDGALYVADMYRREIDHPAYVPEDSRGGLDFTSGRGHGRIYRLGRADSPPVAPPRFASGGAGLIAALEATEPWQRARAQRLLVEQGDDGVAPRVAEAARAGSRPETRVRALWTLAGLRRLSSGVLEAAARDPVAGVREQAVTLAGARLAAEPALGTLLLAAADDDDARVRFLAALALGSWSDPRAVEGLAAVAVRDGAERWARAAVLSGVGGRLEAFQAALAPRLKSAAPAVAAALQEELGRLVGAGGSAEAAAEFLQAALTAPADAGWRVPAILGLAEGRRTRPELKGRPAAELLPSLAGPAGGAALAAAFSRAAARALDSSAEPAQRARAVGLLALTDFPAGLARAAALLDARQAPEVQLQFVRALERLGDARGAELLVRAETWSRYTPQVREAAVAALAAKPAMTRVLFAAIDRGTVRAPEISSVRRAALLKQGNAELRAEAQRLFASLEGGDRMEVYRKAKAGLDPRAPAAAGAAPFARACSACHTFNGVGGKVGPDLTGVGNQPAEALLLHILAPNYEVAPAYQAVTVTTADDRSVTGWVVAETEASLTLRTAAGAEENVLRRNLASLTAAGVSLMPDGLEQMMTPAELYALLAYLKGGAAGG
ncbi:MAG: PVC-type heme-binding CxxCH protein [Opitutaceae bacterium]